MAFAAQQTLETWQRRGLEGTVKFGDQDMPANIAVSILSVEFLVHAWDFAVATNLSYDVDAGVATVLPALQCATDLSTNYAFSFAAGQPQARTFTVLATPGGMQATRDTKCATLSLNQASSKGESGTGTVAECWR